ncbi:MAG: DEAD/DEAH box helicase family protein, partial [Propionibacteriaceae bacterium]|nr:DEAD/DEAH box helicase family protein [Propionibacteriaceae bacterium]
MSDTGIDAGVGRSTFEQVLDAIEAKLPAQVRGGARARGTAFEQAAKFFLEKDPAWKTQLHRVWMWSDQDNPLNPPDHRRQDTGIDLVAQGFDGAYWAVQCKYLASDKIDAKSIATFFTTAHALRDEAGGHQITNGHYIVFSTADCFTSNFKTSADSYGCVFVSKDELSDSTVDWSAFLGEAPHRKFAPFKHQARAIEACRSGFADHDRGKLIMACGTGKTLTSLRLAEQMAQFAEVAADGADPRPFRVLFLAPSIALVSQTFRSWVSQAKEPIASYIVCSDETANRRGDEADSFTTTRLDVPFPTTTNPDQLLRNWRAGQSSQTAGLSVIFATYQSIEVVAAAQRRGLDRFDLVICDEAHRTAGSSKRGEESAFQLVHDQDKILADKRLYMTATPRIFSSKAAEDAKKADVLAYSMDDEAIFGPEFHRLSFGESVAAGILTDYKVLVLAVGAGQISDLGSALAEASPQLQERRQTLERDYKKSRSPQKEARFRNEQEALARQAESFAGKIVGTWNGLLTKGVHADGADIDTGLGDKVQVHLLADHELPGPPGSSDRSQTPVERAIAFTSRIADSKAVAEGFGEVVERYVRDSLGRPERIEGELAVTVHHVDGSMSADSRNRLLRWLAGPVDPGTAKMLSNAKCLTEGVDLPTLDAVVFFQPRRSMVDIVQAVGRVMRKAVGKQYGYIILPVIVPWGATEESILASSDFATVWDTIKAIRSHDERLDAQINTLSLRLQTKAKKAKHRQNQPSRKDFGDQAGPDGQPLDPGSSSGRSVHDVQDQLGFNETVSASFQAKLVKQCGDTAYWDDWVGSISAIATKTRAIIDALLAGDTQATMSLADLLGDQAVTELVPQIQAMFNDFHAELVKTLNPSVSADDARGMIAQQLLTGPIFDALFAEQRDPQGRSFAELNPVSVALEPLSQVLRPLIARLDAKKELESFYQQVRISAQAVSRDADARQQLIKNLYESFFRQAFKQDAERLGIVYTPQEVVKFILSGVDVLVAEHFGKRLSSPGVTVLDPFTGTGTFIVELIRGYIHGADLEHKYRHEIFANELMLLAYYIAMVNIESAYQERRRLLDGASPDLALDLSYLPFPGGVLTDTFQISEWKAWADALVFGANNARIQRENDADITVIVGNPPYSSGQKSGNDNNPNLAYRDLDSTIAQSYVAGTSATNKNALYDSYIRAFRWASNRLADNPDGKGIIGFVSGGGWIDNTAFNGFRKSLVGEFTDVYVINLKGNKEFRRLTKEELSRQGDNIFGSGSKSPIAITFLVRDPTATRPGTVHYLDIGDYLSRSDKLARLSDWAEDGDLAGLFGSADIAADLPRWQTLIPDAHGDWINQRDDSFYRFAPLGLEKLKEPMGVFATYSRGLATGRDQYSYSFSAAQLSSQMRRLIATYDSELARWQAAGKPDKPEDFVLPNNGANIKWNHSLFQQLTRGTTIRFDRGFLVEASYRPFTKRWLYYDPRLIERMYRNALLFPLELIRAGSGAPVARPVNSGSEGATGSGLGLSLRADSVNGLGGGVVNRVIMTPGKSNQGPSFFISEDLVDLNAMNAGAQCFPLYHYERLDTADGQLDFGASSALAPVDVEIVADDGHRFIRHLAITDQALAVFSAAYPNEPLLQGDVATAKESIFYYAYGLLNAPEYQRRFDTTLRKELPRLPLAADFTAFAATGRALADLHCGYERLPAWPTIVEDWSPGSRQLGEISKLQFGQAAKTFDNPKGEDRSVIVVNQRLTLKGIPLAAYGFSVSGRSPIDWLLD